LGISGRRLVMLGPESQPEDYLEESVRAYQNGAKESPRVLALQGILRVLIDMHAYHRMTTPPIEEKNDDDLDVGDDEDINPWGECASGHHVFRSSCPDCATDTNVELDTVPGPPGEEKL
jgi:hypothetical protein